ncbi:MAG: sulfotransferase, partial [Chloroflexota bacterium]
YDAEMAARLRDLFPAMRVIYITRHPFGGFASLLHEERLKPSDINIPITDIWTREKTQRWVDVWTHINQSFLDHPDVDDSWVFRTTYERLINDIPGVTGRMIDWLGMPREAFDLDVFNYRIYTDRADEQHRRDQRPKITWDDLTAEEYRLMTQPHLTETAARLGYDIPVVG